MALPVTLADAKRHLRLDENIDDPQIQDAIDDAAGWVERYTGHLLTEREVTEHFSGLRDATLKVWPIAADAPFAVTYLDAAGEAVTVAGGRLDAATRRARVRMPYGRYWPFPNADQAFSVTITAGYADPTDVPRNLRRAMLVMITAFYEDREGGDTFAKAERSARGLCGDYRWRSL